MGVNRASNVEQHRILSIPANGFTFHELKRLLEKNSKEGSWVVLSFDTAPAYQHPFDSQAHAQFCGWLANQKGKIWISPVETVARSFYTVSAKEKKLTAAGTTGLSD
jgi:hypothetical protein